MKVGVVIGAWRCPSAVRLNLAAIRRSCGDVPVIVCEDYATRTPTEEANEVRERTRAAAQNFGADYFCSPRNLGHGHGDLRALVTGLWWAKGSGLDVLCKLSQRWVCTRPNWLHEAATTFDRTGLSTGSDRCRYAADLWPLRTEAILFNVGRWTGSAEAMKAITPRDLWPHSAEEIVHGGMTTFGDGYWTWPLLGGPDRGTWQPNILWHNANAVSEYHDLAAELGVKLGGDFYIECSSRQKGYGRG